MFSTGQPPGVGAEGVRVNKRVWRGYLLFVFAAVAVYPLLPRGVWKGDVFFDLFGLVAVVAVVGGVWWNRPRDRLPWLHKHRIFSWH